LIVQYVEPDFLDSLDALSKTKAKKVKAYVTALVTHVEGSKTIEDLKRITLSNIQLAKAPRLHILAGKLTQLQFPKQDLYVFLFDEFKLYFCLRGQVCTFLRVEGNG
jgi:hypothetical protein